MAYHDISFSITEHYIVVLQWILLFPVGQYINYIIKPEGKIIIVLLGVIIDNVYLPHTKLLVIGKAEGYTIYWTNQTCTRYKQSKSLKEK